MKIPAAQSLIFNFCILLIIVSSFSCQSITDGTGFDEPSDPNPVPLDLWENAGSGLQVAFGSIDQRYRYHYPPDTKGQESWYGSAWKGERINIQLKIWSREPLHNLKVVGSNLCSDGGDLIDANNIRIYPVRFVLTDEFSNACGPRDPDTIPAFLASDMFEFNQRFNLEKNTLRPVWITIDVPGDAAAGTYEGDIRVTYKGGKDIVMPLTLNIHNLLLPSPDEWSFHLDLWQNPWAVARYYEVEPWSDRHLELMLPYLEMLAEAGQKCITATIIHLPWGVQTYDNFESMIEWTHLGNGQWEYDYSVFDLWVTLAMRAGITRQINCITMVPWDNQVRYFDVDSSGYVTKALETGSTDYADIWRPFLSDFRSHLIDKGWLDRTLIAVDERHLEEMKGLVALLREAAPEFRIALAGGYLAELNDEIYDLSVFYGRFLDRELIKERVERGMPTTFYTSCARPESPNNFTFSPPAEQAWLGWHAAARGFSGYLRWAYNSWVEDPLTDSRFRKWPAGDTYQIYPGPRSSIRFERLREGIQDFEKIRILRELAEKTGQREKLEGLDRVLERFTPVEINEYPADHWLNRGKAIINELSELMSPSN
jgi:hypothetical protein